MRSDLEKWVADLAGLSSTKPVNRELTEAVMSGAVLAQHDAATTGKLKTVTRQALDLMWQIPATGGRIRLAQAEQRTAIGDRQPLRRDDGGHRRRAAPEGYADTPAARTGMEKLRRYLEHMLPSTCPTGQCCCWQTARRRADDRGVAAANRRGLCSDSSGPTAAGPWPVWATTPGNGRTSTPQDLNDQ